MGICYQWTRTMFGISLRLMSRASPFVIAIEGIAKSGKSTLCKKIATYFQTQGLRVLVLPGIDPAQPSWPELRFLVQRGETRTPAQTRRMHCLFVLNKIELENAHMERSYPRTFETVVDIIILDTYTLSALVDATVDACGRGVGKLQTNFCRTPDLSLWLAIDPHFAAARDPHGEEQIEAAEWFAHYHWSLCKDRSVRFAAIGKLARIKASENRNKVFMRAVTAIEARIDTMCGDELVQTSHSSSPSA